MPPPAIAPVLSFSKGLAISNISVGLDATILRSWRDTSEFATSDPEYPYYAMEIKISSFPSYANIVLARYTGGKLKKDALYQLTGRFFIDTSKEGGKSYLHIDQAVRFQGPGTIRSYKKPQFLVVGELVQVYDTHVVLNWVTRDPYRRDMVYEQNAVFKLQEGLLDKEQYLNRMFCIEGSMDGMDHKRDWVCTGMKLS